MASHGSNGYGLTSAHAAINGADASQRTLNGLNRWSVAGNPLPAVDLIRHLHVYDFDNTLFSSPLPNRTLWNGNTIGLLQSQEVFVGGGWWHDADILSATGDGIEKEEGRAWQGWWNENIVDLVRLSMRQKDTLCVLLTGRSETNFPELIQRMIKSKGLEFDMVCLKPEIGPANQKFSSTMKYKQALLETMILTYTEAREMKIYEDRIHHVKAFRDFFEGLNVTYNGPTAAREPIKCEVVEVAEEVKSLEPTREVAEIQRMINNHNLAYREGRAPANARPHVIKRTVFFTGYMIRQEDTQRMLTTAYLPTSSSQDGDFRTLANTIMITPRPAPQNILDRIGGLGCKVRWRATATGTFDNKVWAMKCAPIPASTPIYTETPTPCVVLALSRNARPHDANRIATWQSLPSERSFEFDTVVGEKVLLRIEDEPNPTATTTATANGASKKRPSDSEFPPLGSSQPKAPKPPTGPSAQNNHRPPFKKFQKGGRARNNGRGRGGGGNNRGARAYKSLDDEQARRAGAGASGGASEALAY